MASPFPPSASRPARARAGPQPWLLALALLLLAGPLWAGSVEVITHPDRAGLRLDRNLLRAIFSMRARSWPDGRPARVFVLADDSTLHDAFCREQLAIYPYVLRNAWDRQVYTGTGLAPTLVGSEAEMRRLVESTPGAIGYAWHGAGGDVGGHHDPGR